MLFTNCDLFIGNHDTVNEEISFDTFLNDDTFVYEDMILSLKKEYNNDDVVGKLMIVNTDFEVPVVQGDDNDYYLSHGYYGEENSFGTVFLDYRVDLSTSKKLLIYGHSSSEMDLSFNFLENYYDEMYYHKYPYLEFVTACEKRVYEIFSVYVETYDFSYMGIHFVDDDDFFNHIEYLKSRSIYDTGTSLTGTDEVLILQTCSNHEDYRDYSKKYLLIVARRIQ